MRAAVTLIAIVLLLPASAAGAAESDRLGALCHGYLSAPAFADLFAHYGIGMDRECSCVTTKALAFETEADRQALRASRMPTPFQSRYKAAILQCFRELAR